MIQVPIVFCNRQVKTTYANMNNVEARTHSVCYRCCGSQGGDCVGVACFRMSPLMKNAVDHIEVIEGF